VKISIPWERKIFLDLEKGKTDFRPKINLGSFNNMSFSTAAKLTISGQWCTYRSRNPSPPALKNEIFPPRAIRQNLLLAYLLFGYFCPFFNLFYPLDLKFPLYLLSFLLFPSHFPPLYLPSFYLFPLMASAGFRWGVFSNMYIHLCCEAINFIQINGFAIVLWIRIHQNPERRLYLLFVFSSFPIFLLPYPFYIFPLNGIG
jgi:hypothetical protein